MVITPFGEGIVVQRQESPADYTLQLALDGARTKPISHKHLYLVRLHASPTTTTTTSRTLCRAGAEHPAWLAVSIQQVFSLLSHGRHQCPTAALHLLIACLGTSSEWQDLLVSLVEGGGGGGRKKSGSVVLLMRRDALCLAVGSRQENHYHSSIKTREWMFELPHASPLEIYSFVSWRYSGERCG